MPFEDITVSTATPLIGELVFWCGSITEPKLDELKHKAGLVYCDGRELDKNEWKSLYDVVKDLYTRPGSTPSVGTFCVPDFRGRTAIGSGKGFDIAASYNIGQYLGEVSHTLSLSEMPSHNHASAPYVQLLFTDGNYTVEHTDYTTGEPNLHSCRPIQPQGGDQPHNNMQPSLAVNVFIRGK